MSSHRPVNRRPTSRASRLAVALLSVAALLGGLAACGDDDRAIPADSPASTPDAAEQNAYRLTVRSSRGATDAIRASLCGDPSSELVELPCGVSLGFARVSAPRLYVGRRYDRMFLELKRPASAIFTSLGQGVGDRAVTRNSALTKLDGTGRRFSIGLNPSMSDTPTVAAPTYLSILVVFQADMPVPTPAASGVPKDAVVVGASAEYLVQLATRSEADDES